MSRGYEKRWDETARDGDQGELFARWAANGLRSGASVEVKTDNASWQTGRIFIEFECKVSGQWVPSGIDPRHTRAEIWAHVIVGPVVLFAPIEYVRWVAEKHGQVKELPKRRSTHPTRGYVMPIADFVEALVGIPASRVTDNGYPPPLLATNDPQAPLGRDARGIPAAPHGYTKDRRVRLNPGGKRVGEPIAFEMTELWGDPGMSRDEGYDPQWKLTAKRQEANSVSELYRSGMSIREIAAVTGRSYGSIQREIAQHRLGESSGAALWSGESFTRTCRMTRASRQPRQATARRGCSCRACATALAPRPGGSSLTRR